MRLKINVIALEKDGKTYNKVVDFEDLCKHLDSTKSMDEILHEMT